MSLAREALRMATVRALRGRTWAGDHVRDSEQGAIDDVAENEPRPFVVVYTDDGQFGGGNHHTDLYSNGEQTLLIEIALTRKMVVEQPDDVSEEEQVEVIQPQTDAAMEFVLGVVERQIKNALLDPGNDWSAVIQKLVLRFGQCQSQRGQSMRDGMRFAGRQLIMPCHLIKDPPVGAQVQEDSGFGVFLSALDADPKAQVLKSRFEKLIAAGSGDWPGFKQLHAAYGLGTKWAEAMQLTPATPNGSSEATFDAELGQNNEASNPDFGGI